MIRYNRRLQSIVVAFLCSFLFTSVLLSYDNEISMSADLQFRLLNISYNRSSWGTSLIVDYFAITNLVKNCLSACNSPIQLESTGALPKWSERSHLKENMKKKYTSFKQTMSPPDHSQFVELLTIFRDVCDRKNLTYMLYGGTLLGAYRHLGFIPWDDDVDVFVNGSQRLDIKSALERVPGYSLYTPRGRQWKFFMSPPSSNIDVFEDRDSLDPKSMHYAWPYIDIFFFGENQTHIWDDNPSYTSTYCFDKGIVFPLKTASFENSFYKVPRDTRRFLSSSYNIDLCVTSTYSHKHEVHSRRQASVPCRRLYKYFPFVFRMCNENYLIERLLTNDQSLYERFIQC